MALDTTGGVQDATIDLGYFHAQSHCAGYLFTMLRLHCLFVLDGTTHALLGVVTKASFDTPGETLLPRRSSRTPPTGNDMAVGEPPDVRRRSLGGVVASVLPLSFLFTTRPGESTSTIRSVTSVGTSTATDVGEGAAMAAHRAVSSRF
ncbi:hypothetical protein FOZ62_000712 [Perkinsus olseni]|uniref:Uncharacterized protein n=1 Tax=Perkinsus olseni TaxID=32597 RepID=A0A7J6T3M2_PEROL|nr:hypothetical protein FOZ62_000712 [Perkinsus olseni]